MSKIVSTRPGARTRPPRSARPPHRRRRTWGTRIARLVCFLFALVGIVPLLIGAIVRSGPIQRWASGKTSKVLKDELGIEAEYELRVRLWPPEVELANVRVPATDGGSPFLEARRLVARPRPFSLLAGKVDVGDIEIDEPSIRAVIKNGKLLNLSPTLPEGGDSDGDIDLPFSSLAITNGMVDVVIDDARVLADALDLDLGVENGRYDVSLRLGTAKIDHLHPTAGRPDEEWYDEDILCGLELRGHADASGVTIRKLKVNGSADLDPARGTRPTCDLPDDDWRRVAVDIGGAVVHLKDGAFETAEGRGLVRVPLPLAHRFVSLPPTTGWVEVDVEEFFYEKLDILPRVRGSVRGANIGIDSKLFARSFRTNVATSNNDIVVSKLEALWGDGKAVIAEARVSPLKKGMPVRVVGVAIEGVTLPGLMNDLGAHPDTWVAWTLKNTTMDEFSGTLKPLNLAGLIRANTRDFGIYDRAASSRDKSLLMGVTSGDLQGTFRVLPNEILLDGFQLNTPRSQLRTTVSIGFNETLRVSVFPGSKVNLLDVSPVVGIAISGEAEVDLKVNGKFAEPHITGKTDINNLVFAGFPIGDVKNAKVDFLPLKVELKDAVLTHGKSTVSVPRFSLDFADHDAKVVLSGHVDSRAGTGLYLSDFFHMINRSGDPRFADLKGRGRGTADLHYVMGGRRDPCRSGNLKLRSHMSLDKMHLFGEKFESGEVDFEYLWDDIAANEQGLRVNVHSAVLRKGKGTIVARASVGKGAQLEADVTGNAIPLDHFDAISQRFGTSVEDVNKAVAKIRPEANVSFVAVIGGTLGRLEGRADVDVSPLRIGPDSFPASRLTVDIIPQGPVESPIGRTTSCGNPIMPQFSMANYRQDRSDGVYRLGGSLFDGQVRLDNFEITQQRKKVVRGRVNFEKFNLGAVANIVPGVAFSALPPRGEVTASLEIDSLPIENIEKAEARLRLHEISMRRGTQRIAIKGIEQPIVWTGDTLTIPALPLDAGVTGVLGAKLKVGGTIRNLSTNPLLSIALVLDPISLSELGSQFPSVERAAGTMRGRLAVEGSLELPKLTGQLSIDRGLVKMRGFPVVLDEIEVNVEVGDGEIQVSRARARVGNTGVLSMSARVPLSGFEVAGATASIVARDISVPVADGIDMTANANLTVSYDPAQKRSDQLRALPNITGTVALTKFAYTRPVTFSLDLDELTGGGRTLVESYRPENDLFAFDIKVVSPRPLRFSNNLMDMKVRVASSGLQIVGTNQRYGAIGSLAIESGSKFILQGHDFRIANGTVEFDNPKSIKPKLDVTANTEFRRNAASGEAAADATGGLGTGSKWRIALRAYGDTENPQVRFSSDPPLSQDDIVLLLQIGMTRAELDRSLAGSLAQTVGLEALTAVTGLDQVVRKTVPLIDEFRLGSQYSSRSGRSQPTVTVGKRITDNIRATITTGLNENREVQSNIEWKLSRGVSVQASYDNVNNISSSSLGNIGLNLRWRLEFD